MVFWSKPVPSGVTSRESLSGYTYNSTCSFPLIQNESHAGTYTCRVGAGRLANSTNISIDGMEYFMLLHMIRHLFFDSTLCMINYFCTVQIVSSEVPMLGQSYSLMCNVQVTDYTSLPRYMSYWWTKNNESVTQLELEGGTQQNKWIMCVLYNN